jgi:hypothetical protein
MGVVERVLDGHESAWEGLMRECMVTQLVSVVEGRIFLWFHPMQFFLGAGHTLATSCDFGPFTSEVAMHEAVGRDTGATHDGGPIGHYFTKIF